MKKKSAKTMRGFTLIEILIAMAILAIASMVLVTMYASISKRIKSNNEFNDRMIEQQVFAEASSTSNGGDSLIQNTADIKFDLVCVTNNANTAWVNKKNFVINGTVYEYDKLVNGQPVSSGSDDDVNFKIISADNSLQ